MKKLAVLSLAAIISLQLPAMAEEAKDAVIAKVAGVEIREGELALAESNIDPQLSQLPADQRRVAALSALVDAKLLAAKARAEGLDQNADYKMRLQFLTDRELHNAYFKKHVVEPVTDADIKARYDKEVAAMPKEDEVHARHILVKTEDEAKAVIKALDEGKDFAALAKEKSTDPNKSDGGDLGFFRKGQMVPEFEAAAFELAPGSHSKTPVKTQFGFHVIKVEEKRPVAAPELDKIKDQVRQVIMRDAYLALLTKEKAEATVDIVDPVLKKAYEEANKPAK
jgi:peptidyl-prolyl cis-trans isomerase C